MLSDHERDELLERQARVYELLDVATKPEQWLLGGLKLLLLAVIVVAVFVGTPIYYLCTGGTVTYDMVANAVTALATLILFFLCPYYVVCGGTLFWGGLGWWLFDHPHQTFFQSPRNILIGFVLVGYGQYALRKLARSLSRR